MPFPLFRQLPYSLIVLLLVLFAAGRAGAELVWTPQSGWQVQGGALDGLKSTDAKSALGMMNRARAAEEKGNKRTAIKYYDKVAKKYANSVYAPEAQYRLGNLRLSRKEYTKAFEAFRTIATRYPSTTRFDELIGKQYHIASLLLDGARSRFFWGLLPGFTSRDKSVEYFESLIVEAPYSDYAPLALMNVAIAQQRLRNTDEAIDALDRFINTYSQNVLTPDAYLKVAQAYASLVQGAYYDQGSTRDAITYFEDFLILFPGDQNTAIAEKGLNDMRTTLAESKLKIADFYFYRRANYKAARVFYNEAITVYPDSSIATKARERLVAVEKESSRPPEKKKKTFLFF